MLYLVQPLCHGVGSSPKAWPRLREKPNSKVMEGKKNDWYHSHIVFDVDDGPKTERTACLIGRKLSPRGADHYLTSHRRKGCLKLPKKDFWKFSEVKKLRPEVAPDLLISLRGEIYFTNDVLKKLEEKIIPRLANANFALIEFSMGAPYKEIHDLSRLLHLGAPVVAIERYKCLEVRSICKRWLTWAATYSQ